MSRRRRSNKKSSVLNNSLTDLSRQISSQGTGGSFLSSYGTQAFSNNYTLLSLNRIILTYMYTGNGIFQTAIQLPIQDAIGKGIEIESGEMDNVDIDAVLDYWEDNRVWDTILNAWTWVRLFGGGAIMINTDQDPEKPLSLKRIQNKPVEFYDLDRWQMDVNAAYFDDWDSYINAGGGMINVYGEPIHASRFLRGQGKRAPHYVRRQLRGWGMSEGERMIRDLNLYMKTQDVNFEILDEAKVDIYKIQGLAAKLMTAGGTSAITTRVQAANEIKNYVNALVLDSNEDYQQKQMGFAGLAEVMQQNRMGVAAALRIPMTKLFGMSASGFNTGESDLENYNSMIESEIRSPLRPWIRQLLKVTMSHLFGYVPEFRFTFPSLREQTPEVEQQVKDAEYNRAAGLYDRGLLSAKEMMQILRKSGVVDIETEVETGANPNPEPPNGAAGIEDSALPGKLAGEDEGYKVIRNIKNKGIEKTMSEFKKGTLKTPQGKTVTDKDQAIAIGLSEERGNSGHKIFRKKNSEMSEELSRTGLYKKGDKLKYDPKELEMGIQIELEHADDKEAAKQIALDHLMEDPKYYSKLKKAGL